MVEALWQRYAGGGEAMGRDQYAAFHQEMDWGVLDDEQWAAVLEGLEAGDAGEIGRANFELLYTKLGADVEVIWKRMKWEETELSDRSPAETHNRFARALTRQAKLEKQLRQARMDRVGDTGRAVLAAAEEEFHARQRARRLSPNGVVAALAGEKPSPPASGLPAPRRTRALARRPELEPEPEPAGGARARASN